MNSPIRGQTRELIREVEATVPMNIHNRFDIEVIDSVTGKIRQRAQAENVICSQLWVRLFAPNTYFNYIHYGTGNGTPASADTSLFTFLGYGTPSANNDVYTISLTNCVYSLRRKIQLSETTAVGSTLTEVGIGYSSSASTLCTHAMLRDANGNQISISKTNTDIINIYASVFVHWNSSFNSGNIVASPTKETSYFLKYLTGLYDSASYYKPPTFATLTNGRNMGSNTTYISGTPIYSASTKTITITFSRIAANSGNVVGGYEYVNLCSFYSSPAPYSGEISLEAGANWFAGSNIVAEAIGTGNGSTKDFATAFDYPSNATIYINGSAASDVTVDSCPINNTQMQKYFNGIVVENGVTYPALPSYGTPANYGIPKGIYYNPLFSYGITSIQASDSSAVISVSNDLTTWVTVVSGTSSLASIPPAYQKYKYWQISSGYLYNVTADTTLLTGKNIHFSTAPAPGAVITGDYHTPVIAKDTNHVFDLTVTIQLGEYTA